MSFPCLDSLLSLSPHLSPTHFSPSCVHAATDSSVPDESLFHTPPPPRQPMNKNTKVPGAGRDRHRRTTSFGSRRGRHCRGRAGPNGRDSPQRLRLVGNKLPDKLGCSGRGARRPLRQLVALTVAGTLVLFARERLRGVGGGGANTGAEWCRCLGQSSPSG